MITKIKIQGYRIYADFTLLPNKELNSKRTPNSPCVIQAGTH